MRTIFESASITISIEIIYQKKGYKVQFYKELIKKKQYKYNGLRVINKGLET
jgi:hypothetical protein